MGIVPLDGTEDHAIDHKLKRHVSTLSGSPTTSSSSEEETTAQHYAGDPTESRLKKAFTSRFTTRGLTERLLRRTVRKNTWIYVAVRCNLHTLFWWSGLIIRYAHLCQDMKCELGYVLKSSHLHFSLISEWYPQSICLSV